MLCNAKSQHVVPYCLNLASRSPDLPVDVTSVSHDSSMRNVTPQTVI